MSHSAFEYIRSYTLARGERKQLTSQRSLSLLSCHRLAIEISLATAYVTCGSHSSGKEREREVFKCVALDYLALT